MITVQRLTNVSKKILVKTEQHVIIHPTIKYSAYVLQAFEVSDVLKNLIYYCTRLHRHPVIYLTIHFQFIFVFNLFLKAKIVQRLMNVLNMILVKMELLAVIQPTTKYSANVHLASEVIFFFHRDTSLKKHLSV